MSDELSKSAKYNSNSYRSAHMDSDFLSRSELRPVRLQLETLKTDLLLAEAGINSTVVVFGSARTRDEEQLKKQIAALEKEISLSPNDEVKKNKLLAYERLKTSVKFYDIAREFGKIVSSNEIKHGKKLIIVTGGGPGIMEAANRGAYDAGAKSIGLNITLTHEKGPNPYVTPELCFQFHYFAIRKMQFVSRSRALVVFPGGFGTMDELFEVLTLVQTGKKTRIPIILVGKEFWNDILNFSNFAKWGYIADEDVNLFHFAETAQEIWEYIKKFYEHGDVPANAA